METMTIILIWLAGVAISYLMLRTEHEAEGSVYTIGDKLLNILFSSLSWLMILTIVTRAWIHSIARTGYWNQPVSKPKKQVKRKTE